VPALLPNPGNVPAIGFLLRGTLRHHANEQPPWP
jgi:hypothetical protein